MRELWDDTWRSFRSLPAWVQAWAAWLVVVNVGVAMREDRTGRMARLPTVAFLTANAAIVVAERGYSKRLSFAHLVAWPRLVVTCARRALDPDLERSERVAAGLLAASNAASLGFDVVDSVAWLRGDRAVAGEGPLPLDAT